MKKINCDVVVVGAGPGGSMAAKTCAKYGLDTVLVERKAVVGKPHASSVLVNPRIWEYLKFDKKLAEPVYGFQNFSPDGTEIHWREPDGYEAGYILNRDNFDKELIKMALKEGTELYLKTRATGLIKENGQIKGIKAKIDEKEEAEIRSNIIIGADGEEGKIGRCAGIYKRLGGGSMIFLLF